MYRLVVIDDEYIVVQGIKALISRLKLDYEVVGAAYDGIQGLEVIRSEKPDVVITDIRIPGLDGLSVIEAAKEECPDTYFIVISGYSEFVYAQRALTLGVKDYIDKPVTADKLKKALTRIEDEWAKTRHEDNRKAQANREKFQELERTFERSVKCITDCDAAAFREECLQAIRCLQADCRQSPAFAGFCYCWNRFSDIMNIRRAVFFMMTKNTDKKREQMMMFSMDDMVPQNHMLRLIDKAINWNFIYDLVEEKYCPNNGRPSMDPVMLIKIPFIQYLYGIKSMRQTMKEIEVNVAYRWFLGLDMLDPVPHFSTFGKNYTRRFKDTDLFEQIFSKILEDCMKYKLVNTEQIFVDATHVKACANSKKMRKRVAHEQALWYEEELNKEIEKDRLTHEKKPLKKR